MIAGWRCAGQGGVVLVKVVRLLPLGHPAGPGVDVVLSGGSCGGGMHAKRGVLVLAGCCSGVSGAAGQVVH